MTVIVPWPTTPGHDADAVKSRRSVPVVSATRRQGIPAEVIELRSIQPLHKDAVRYVVRRTGRLFVVDEDYLSSELSGELAAMVLEAGIPFRYARAAHSPRFLTRVRRFPAKENPCKS